MLEHKREAIAKAEREGGDQWRRPIGDGPPKIIRLKESDVRPSEIASRLGTRRRAYIGCPMRKPP
jgi:hypothetical protein